MKRSESGQILLMAVGIIMVLLICIPTLIFFNSTGVRHQAQSQKQALGKEIAEAGIAYAAAQLADPTIWNAALTGDFTGINGWNSDVTATNVTGTQFRLKFTYVAGSPQIGVLSTAWVTGSNGALLPVKSLQVFLTKKTLGAFTATGVRASAALEFIKFPTLNGTLDVNWGPVVNFDPNTATIWTLNNNLDTKVFATPALTIPGYPRKFSTGPIVGTSPLFPRSAGVPASSIPTDNKEYWANASLDFPDTVYQGAYAATAEAKTTMPANTGCSSPGQCGQSLHAGSGHYYAAPGATISFDSTFAPPVGSIVYIEGDAVFNNLQLDLGTSGALIVTGNATFNAGGGRSLNLNIPSTAPKEYPYWPTSGTYAQWPCAAQCNPAPIGNSWKDAPGTCTVANLCPNVTVNYRGFLWVKGNAFIVGGNWIMSGAMMVGDPGQINKLTVPFGSTLTLYYDEQVNHNVLVMPR